MLLNRKGQGAALVGMVLLLMAFAIYFIAIPFVDEFIDYGASQSGTATAFVIRSIPWVVLILLVVYGIKLIIYGGGS